MKDGVTITIEGTEEIDRALKRLEGLGARKRDVTKVFSTAMRPLIQAGKAEAPKRTGTLRKSIKFKTSKRYKKVWYIVPDKRGWYSHFIGRGTKRIRPNPFMDRAWAQKGNDVLNNLEKGLLELAKKIWRER